MNSSAEAKATEPEPANDAELTRDQLRSRRKRDVRARTISIKRLSKAELEAGRREYPEDTRALRPKTRADCANVPRPCPFVSCSHHLYLDVSPRTGAIKLNFPDLEPHELTHSCSLDIADQGGSTLEEAGEVINLTRERIRQCEVVALAKVQAVADLSELRDFAESGGDKGKRRLPVINRNTLAFLDERPSREEECEE
jgi:hypothetical protein